MRDFTLEIYKEMLLALRESGRVFQTVEQFIDEPEARAVVLRHDVDLRNWAALRLARLEHALGVQSTYYFRVTKQSYSPSIIREIASMGHEIGYHYEDLATCDGDMDRAIKSFTENLKMFRKFYPVKTICMHGSSGSSFDNRDIWKRYSLTDFGLICEPYLSIDYDKVLYLSDTGRCWNGFRMSLRDNVKSRYNFDLHSTQDVIDAIGSMPDQVLFTAHPEQWTDLLPEWLFVKSFSIAHTYYKILYRNRKIRSRSRQ